jgi:hypothetical protein
VGCHFRFSRHIAAHVPSNVSYLRGNPFTFTVYQFSSFSPPPLLLLLPQALSLSRFLVPRHCMPIKRVAHRSKMVKKGAKKQVAGWTASIID